MDIPSDELLQALIDVVRKGEFSVGDPLLQWFTSHWTMDQLVYDAHFGPHGAMVACGNRILETQGLGALVCLGLHGLYAVAQSLAATPEEPDELFRSTLLGRVGFSLSRFAEETVLHTAMILAQDGEIIEAVARSTSKRIREVRSAASENIAREIFIARASIDQALSSEDMEDVAALSPEAASQVAILKTAAASFASAKTLASPFLAPDVLQEVFPEQE